MIEYDEWTDSDTKQPTCISKFLLKILLFIVDVVGD